MIPRQERRHVLHAIRAALNADSLGGVADALRTVFNHLVPLGKNSVSVHWVLPVVPTDEVVNAMRLEDQLRDDEDTKAIPSASQSLSDTPRLRRGAVWLDPTRSEICYCVGSTRDEIRAEPVYVDSIGVLNDNLRYVVMFQEGWHETPGSSDPASQLVLCKPLKSMKPGESGLVETGLSVQAAAWGAAIYVPELKSAQGARDPLAALSEICRYDDQQSSGWSTGWELAMPIRTLAPPDKARILGLPALAVVDIEAPDAVSTDQPDWHDHPTVLSIDAAARLFSAYEYFRSSQGRGLATPAQYDAAWKFCLSLLSTERGIESRVDLYRELTEWLIQSAALPELKFATVMYDDAKTDRRRAWKSGVDEINQDLSKLDEWAQRSLETSRAALTAMRNRESAYILNTPEQQIEAQTDLPAHLGLSNVYVQPILSHMHLDAHGVLMLGWGENSPEREVLTDYLSRLCYVVGSIDAVFHR